MSLKKFVLSVIAVFVVIFAFDFVWHGQLLTETYKATAQFWRGPEAMQQYFPLAMAFQLIFAILFTWIFSRNFENKGLGEGLRFGIYLGLFTGFLQAGIYPYMPIPVSLAVMWFLGSFLETVLVGITLSLIFKE